MTAEVAILNKQCVALAADSIVTVTSRMGEKTYDTGNKLFTLSKFHPVGVLTYGAVEVNTVPIEVLIKEFRDLLGNRSRPSIEKYSDAFFRFIRAKMPRSKRDDERNFNDIVRNHFRTLRERFSDECQRRGIPVDQRKISNSPGAAIFDGVLNRFLAGIARAGKNRSLAGVTQTRLLKKYPVIISKNFNNEFSRYSPTPARKKAIVSAALSAILSNRTSDVSCGIVITGYGAKDYYPSLISHETEGFIGGRLKKVSSKVASIRTGNESGIFTFAQRRAALLFLQGIDPNFERFIKSNIRTLIPGIASVIEKYIPKKNVVRVVRKRLEKTAADFVAQMDRKLWNDFTRPIYDAVDLLDKPELAIFAENLVRLTALRQKVSLEIETVGGEIDVAVISKHDGFIWIKRKHYFDRTLNPFFTEKYLQ